MEQSYGCSNLCDCVSRENLRRERRDLGLRGGLLGIVLKLCSGLFLGWRGCAILFVVRIL